MPAYSIGKELKKPSFVNNSQAPGVGTYNSHEKYSSKVMRGPTYIIGRSMRLKTDKPVGPGPNSYDIAKQSFFADHAKGYHISGKIRQRMRSEGPGPGAYSIPKFFSSKYYSFGLKPSKSGVTQNLPGPGTYQPEKIRHMHAISFQQSKRPSLQSSPRYLKPGPTDYNSQHFTETKNKFSFPKRDKFFEDEQQIKQKVKVPGPGTYSNLSINNIKKHVLVSKFNKTRRDFVFGEGNIPGPGAYSPTNSAHKRSAVAIIGNSPKAIKQTIKIQVLQHTTYLSSIMLKENSRQQCKNNSNIRFGKTQREFFSSNDFKTGPGSYNIDTHNRGHAYSISGRNSQERILKMPGPVEYSPKYQSQFRKTEMVVMGKDKKFQDQSDKNPGPGAYEIEVVKHHSKTFYFPKSQRKHEVNHNPGPGTYEIKQLIGSQTSQDKK